MGAGLSNCPPLEPNLNLGDIPESCIACVLTYLDPPEICNLARLNGSFHRASLADFVWESKLPSNYQFIARKVFDEIPDRLSKKEIYAKLCRHNLFDRGTKDVWLEKRSGGICFAISYQALRITGIEDRRYWNHIPTDESRFRTVAYLRQIWWVEVKGELEFQFPPGRFSLFFRLQLGRPSKRLGRRICNSEQVHGWDLKPVQFQLSTSNGQRAISQCYLGQTGDWVHYHVGDFVVDDQNTSMKIKFSMVQIDCTHTKGGLCLDSVLICPSELRERLVRKF